MVSGAKGAAKGMKKARGLLAGPEFATTSNRLGGAVGALPSALPEASGAPDNGPRYR
jgi:hypothetical protein